MDNLPEITVDYNSRKLYDLFIDGKKIDYSFYHDKRGLTRYLKRKYDIDLRTDKRIIKNYKEYKTTLIQDKNGVKTYVKTLL
jgi:hypothetical protein